MLYDHLDFKFKYVHILYFNTLCCFSAEGFYLLYSQPTILNTNIDQLTWLLHLPIKRNEEEKWNRVILMDKQWI